MALEHSKKEKTGSGVFAVVIAILALAVALVALVMSGGDNKGAGVEPESSLDKTRSSKVLRVGYSGFRPYTIIDLNASDPSKRVTGLCVDMVNEIAARQSPQWKVEWHKVNFETLKADIESGKFDVFADAVYQTVPRAAEFGYTRPYSYFGVAVGLVRRGEESRFSSFSDLNRQGITISLAEGWTSTEYARRVLTEPDLHIVAVGDDPFVQFQEVTSGRADIALQDVPTVMQFAGEHPDEVSALWLDDPPTYVAAGFMTRQGDWEMLHFLNVSLTALQADGTLAQLEEKWNSLSDWPQLNLKPGSGLRNR